MAAIGDSSRAVAAGQRFMIEVVITPTPPAARPPTRDEKGTEHNTSSLAYTIPGAVAATGLSRSTLYGAITKGELKARKCGKRTIILDSDMRRWLESLPFFTVSTPNATRNDLSRKTHGSMD
jgi:predicted DNA-binding transcriptional regulator AlpA